MTFAATGIMQAGGLKLRAVLGLASVAALMIACGVALSARADESKTGELVIAISGLETDRGVLVVALMESAEDFASDSHALRSDSVPVKGGKASVTFRDLPYGRYAVKVYHDENSNGKLDTNFVGYPKEGFGFSNDAMGRFGPPSFEQARFEFASEKLQIAIHSK